MDGAHGNAGDCSHRDVAPQGNRHTKYAGRCGTRCTANRKEKKAASAAQNEEGRCTMEETTTSESKRKKEKLEWGEAKPQPAEDKTCCRQHQEEACSMEKVTNEK